MAFAHFLTIGILVLCSSVVLMTLAKLETGVSTCPKGKEKCGAHCFNPSSQKCHGNATSGTKQITCFKGESLCGNETTRNLMCYDSNSQECHIFSNDSMPKSGQGHGDDGAKKTLLELAVVCYKGQEPCGTRKWATCYNPNKQICFHPNGTGQSAIVCSKGQTHCGDSSCMDEEIHKCVEGTGTGPSAKSFTCYKGQQVCGHSCYNSASEVCHATGIEKYPYRTCKMDEKLCGPYYCYDPVTHDCVDDKVCVRGHCIKG